MNTISYQTLANELIKKLNNVKSPYNQKQINTKVWERENIYRIYVDNFQGNASFYIQINRLTKEYWTGIAQGLCHSAMKNILKLADIQI